MIFEKLEYIIRIKEKGKGMTTKKDVGLLMKIFSPSNILISICVFFFSWAFIDAAWNGSLIKIAGPKGAVGAFIACVLFGQISVFLLGKLFLFLFPKSLESKKPRC
jgi:hypothetical protein